MGAQRRRLGALELRSRSRHRTRSPRSSTSQRSERPVRDVSAHASPVRLSRPSYEVTGAIDLAAIGTGVGDDPELVDALTNAAGRRRRDRPGAARASCSDAVSSERRRGAARRRTTTVAGRARRRGCRSTCPSRCSTRVGWRCSLAGRGAALVLAIVVLLDRPPPSPAPVRRCPRFERPLPRRRDHALTCRSAASRARDAVSSVAPRRVRCPADEDRTIHRCTECGCESPAGSGGARHARRGARFEEVAAAPPRRRSDRRRHGRARADRRGGPARRPRRPTGIGELDRVLGGGLAPGRSRCSAGEPGIGKCTLLLQALGRMAAAGARCLLVAAEESSAQVRRAGRAARRARARRCSSSRRRRCRTWSRTSRRSAPTCSRSTPSRPSLDPDLAGRAGLGHAGARLRVPPRAAGEGARARHGARRPRHEGGHARGPARARARRRHRALVRRRSRSRAALSCTRSSTASAPPTSSGSSR